MDKMLHDITEINYYNYMIGQGEDADLLEHFNDYIKFGFNENHGNFIRTNYNEISIVMAYKFLELCNINHVNVPSKQFDNLVDVIKYILGVKPAIIDSFKNVSISDARKQVIQCISDIFEHNNKHYVDVITINNLKKVVNNIGNDHYSVAKYDSNGAHSIVFKLDLKSKYCKTQSHKHLITKIMITDIKKSKLNECRNTYYRYREICELFINILTMTYGENHVGKIVGIHSIEYTKSEYLLCVIYERMPYSLCDIMDKHIIKTNAHFDMIVTKLIEIVYQLYNLFGLVHHDLKPDNIMINTNKPKDIINNNFEIKIIDFGISNLNHSIDCDNIQQQPEPDPSGYDIWFFLIHCYKYFQFSLTNKKNTNIDKYVFKWFECVMPMITLHVYDKYDNIGLQMSKNSQIWKDISNTNLTQFQQYKSAKDLSSYTFVDKCVEKKLITSIDILKWKIEN